MEHYMEQTCLLMRKFCPTFKINAQEHLDPIGRSGSDHGGLVKGEGEDVQWIIGDPDLLLSLMILCGTNAYQTFDR